MVDPLEGIAARSPGRLALYFIGVIDMSCPKGLNGLDVAVNSELPYQFFFIRQRYNPPGELISGHLSYL